LRRSRRDSAAAAGGVLVELVLAVLLVAAGAALWVAWKRGAFSVGNLRKGPLALAQRSEDQGRVKGATSPLDDAAWLQRQTRELLAKSGVADAHVLKTFNRERGDGKDVWLEDTLELKRPARFEAAAFLDGLERALEKRELSVVRDLREDGKWTLELGRGGRVFQRVVFLK
jgi:hypothetical protein